MKYKISIAVLIAVLILGTAVFFTFKTAPQDTAKPTVFNEDTAMLAIFGSYNVQNKGVLLPEKNTTAWNMKEADRLVTPLLTATYTEGGKLKGVVAMQRQQLIDGEVIDSHGQTADISVYVFGFNGTQWVFEKGKKEVTSAGAYGNAPGGKLIRLGDDKYGLLFEGGFFNQGRSVSSVFIIPLSEPKFFDALDLQTGEDNGGTCSDDPKDREDGGLEACWESSGTLAFLKQTNTPYYVLKATTVSNEPDDDGKQSPRSTDEFYIYTPKGYVLTKDKLHMSGSPVPEGQIYNVDNARVEDKSVKPASKKKKNNKQ